MFSCLRNLVNLLRLLHRSSSGIRFSSGNNGASIPKSCDIFKNCLCAADSAAFLFLSSVAITSSRSFSFGWSITTADVFFVFTLIPRP